MTEDDSQLEPRAGGEITETNNSQSVAMERIKELEKTLKLKETEL